MLTTVCAFYIADQFLRELLFRPPKQYIYVHQHLPHILRDLGRLHVNECQQPLYFMPVPGVRVLAPVAGKVYLASRNICSRCRFVEGRREEDDAKVCGGLARGGRDGACEECRWLAEVVEGREEGGATDWLEVGLIGHLVVWRSKCRASKGWVCGPLMTQSRIL